MKQFLYLIVLVLGPLMAVFYTNLAGNKSAEFWPIFFFFGIIGWPLLVSLWKREMYCTGRLRILGSWRNWLLLFWMSIPILVNQYANIVRSLGHAAAAERAFDHRYTCMFYGFLLLLGLGLLWSLTGKIASLFRRSHQ